jgi:hypothetical protein
MVGTTFGHYQITGRLDKGGMGAVYVADALNLNRKVALKFLPDAFAGDPEDGALRARGQAAAVLRTAHQGPPNCSALRDEQEFPKQSTAAGSRCFGLPCEAGRKVGAAAELR